MVLFSVYLKSQFRLLSLFTVLVVPQGRLHDFQMGAAKDNDIVRTAPREGGGHFYWRPHEMLEKKKGEKGYPN